MHYQIILVIEAGEGGIWSVSIDPSSVMPQFTNDNPPLLIAKDEVDKGRLGTWSQWYEYNLFRAFGSRSDVEKLLATVKMFGSQSVDELVGGLKCLMDGLKFTVIMPAGDAFYFKGVDTDAEGNMYSHVSYATPSGGEQIRNA